MAWGKCGVGVIAPLLVVLALFFPPSGKAQNIALPDGATVAVKRFEALPDAPTMVWVPSEYGWTEGHWRLARALATQGITSWIPEFYEAYFLPAAPSSLMELPQTSVEAVIEAAARAAGDKVYLFSNDRGTALALAAANHLPGMIRGVVAVTPYLIEGTPAVGEAPRYVATTSGNTLPLYALQPELSPGYWRLSELRAELEQGGGPVYLQRVSQVRDRYFFRIDATPQEVATASRLPSDIARAIAALARQEPAPSRAQRLDLPHATQSGVRGLQVYAANPVPRPLALPDLNGRQITLGDFAGKVVVINFWASWCPPCVHEMPSLQALQSRYAKRGLVVLGVNMAEPDATVRGFMAAQRLTFVTALDREGAVLRDWQVVAFPTSFLVDRSGHIRYGLYGAIDWLDEDAVIKIERLLME